MDNLKTYQFGVDRRVAGIDTLVDNIAMLAKREADSYDLYEMLNQLINSFLQTQPEGDKNYGKGENSLIGRVYIGTPNNSGNAIIGFTPTSTFLKNNSYYNRHSLGHLNIKADIRKFSIIYSGKGPDSPKLISDTKKVMEALGLKEDESF